MKTVIPLHLRDRETVSPVEDQNTRFALVITSDGTLVNNTTHDTRRARRDTCVDVLQTICGGTAAADEMRNILRLFGGADPDAAIGQISALYAEEGIDIYLEDQPVPAVPERGVPVALYSIFEGYENSAHNTLTQFPSAEERTAALHRKLSNLGAAVPLRDGLTEDKLAARLEETLNRLVDQKVTVRLVLSSAPSWV